MKKTSLGANKNEPVSKYLSEEQRRDFEDTTKKWELTTKKLQAQSDVIANYWKTLSENASEFLQDSHREFVHANLTFIRQTFDAHTQRLLIAGGVVLRYRSSKNPRASLDAALFLRNFEAMEQRTAPINDEQKLFELFELIEAHERFLETEGWMWCDEKKTLMYRGRGKDSEGGRPSRFVRAMTIKIAQALYLEGNTAENQEIVLSILFWFLASEARDLDRGNKGDISQGLEYYTRSLKA